MFLSLFLRYKDTPKQKRAAFSNCFRLSRKEMDNLFLHVAEILHLLHFNPQYVSANSIAIICDPRQSPKWESFSPEHILQPQFSFYPSISKSTRHDKSPILLLVFEVLLDIFSIFSVSIQTISAWRPTA